MIRLLLLSLIVFALPCAIVANPHLPSHANDSLHYLIGEDIGTIQNFVLVKFANEQQGDVIIRLMNQNNEVTKEYIDAQVEPGFHQAFVDVKQLEPGEYQLIFIHLHHRKTTKFVISS